MLKRTFLSQKEPTLLFLVTVLFTLNGCDDKYLWPVRRKRFFRFFPETFELVSLTLEKITQRGFSLVPRVLRLKNAKFKHLIRLNGFPHFAVMTPWATNGMTTSDSSSPSDLFGMDFCRLPERMAIAWNGMDDFLKELIRGDYLT